MVPEVPVSLKSVPTIEEEKQHKLAKPSVAKKAESTSRLNRKTRSPFQTKKSPNLEKG